MMMRVSDGVSNVHVFRLFPPLLLVSGSICASTYVCDTNIHVQTQTSGLGGKGLENCEDA